jgi:fatty-acyl-CoA synthase
MSIPSLSWSPAETLWMRWTRHADRSPNREAFAFVRAGEPTLRFTWSDLLQRATYFAHWLRNAGVKAGDTCAIMTRHNADFCPLYLAACGIGAIPSVLAPPNTRLHPDKFREGLLGIARQSCLDWMLIEQDLEAALLPLISAEGSTIRGVLRPFSAALTATTDRIECPSSPDHPAVLQHSSGTTGLQKAVMLSHRMILEHATSYGSAIDVNPDDRVVSWLPLYHDMGLIAAFHLPLALGIPTVHLDPFEWIAAPILLIEALAAERGTLSWLPNFAYTLMGTRLRDEDLDGLSLSSVRLLINCSEPVRPDSHAALLARLGKVGLRARQFAASYAMAEATFAVTQTPVGAGVRELLVARDALQAGVARAPQPGELTRACASSGAPIAGCEIRAFNDCGAEVAEHEVGELGVRSTSLFTGYRNRPDLTQGVMRGSWYMTGDYGFRSDGEWFVVGRKKDLIIVAGKNLYPEDIEAAASSVAGVIPGRLVAFGMDDQSTGTQHVCVCAETEAAASHHPSIQQRIVTAVQAIDVTVNDVFLVPPRWLIKSSSGKPSRSANRDRILAQASTEEPR